MEHVKLDRLLRVREVAEVLGISRSFAYDLIYRRVLPAENQHMMRAANANDLKSPGGEKSNHVPPSNPRHLSHAPAPRGPAPVAGLPAD